MTKRLGMISKRKEIYSLTEFMKKYKFIPKPVITKNHKWMIDEYIWYCMECELELNNLEEIRKEIFDKAFPILVDGKLIKYLDNRVIK